MADNVLQFRPRVTESETGAPIYLMDGDAVIAVIRPDGDLVIMDTTLRLLAAAPQAGKFAGLFRMIAKLTHRIETLETERMKE